MKRLAKLGVMSFACVALSAAAIAQTPQKVLRFVPQYESTVLDPVTSILQVTHQAALLPYDTLMARLESLPGELGKPTSDRAGAGTRRRVEWKMTCAASATVQAPSVTCHTSEYRPPPSQRQALSASTAHSCERSSGRSSD